MLKQLHETLKRVGAIGELGGIGKTQTALRYAYKHRDEYDEVFWVRATSETDINSGFVEIAHLLNSPLKDATDVKVIVDAVKRWLADHTGWLLIFDKADTPEVVKPFLPRNVQGHVLVTSRASVFHRLGRVDRVPLDKMKPDKAREFLFLRTGRKEEEARPREIKAANDIAEKLGYLPLALEQAAAFITEMGSSFHDYLTSYRTCRLQLLEEHRPVAGDYDKSVVTTWTMNVKALEKASEPSADLLKLSAFLHPDRIPLELVKKGAPELGDALAAALRNVDADPLALDKVLEPLAGYSLIRRDRKTDTYDIHRLVQEVLKARMKEPDRRLWAERAVRVVDKAFPHPEFENWSVCEQLLPHARRAADLVDTWNFEFPGAGRLLSQTALYLHDRAQYTEAKGFYERALEIHKAALGPDHHDVATTLGNLARLYETQGYYDKAENQFNSALKILEATLGPDHEEVARMLNHLAWLYRAEGRYDDGEAEKLCKRALDIYKAKLPPDHPWVATALSNLAQLYRAQRRYAEAEPLCRRALEIRQKIMPRNHPDVAWSQDVLADLYRAQAKYDDAEKLCKEALKINKKAVGSDHPLVATTTYNLARLYDDQGKDAKAERLYKRALETYKKALGPDHPRVATVLENYAGLLRKLGRDDEAAKTEARAEAIRAKHREKEKK